MNVVRQHLKESEWQDTKAHNALAAALVHDLGHGPYSHAFEEVGRRLKLAMADHEKVTDQLIREGEISNALNKLGSGFASDVADVIKKAGSANIYGAVVSSQFDADRLDYMQRDRLMTGTHHGVIDFDWLLSNLQVARVPYGADDEGVGEIETFVLGPKATHAAETYLLGLFQLYATVYLHKATRGAEKIFTELLARVVQLTRDGARDKTGLSENHPIIQFAKTPERSESILALDDSVVAGALSMMTEAQDKLISNFSRRLRDRKLYKCFDVRERLNEAVREKSAKKSKAPVDEVVGKVGNKPSQDSKSRRSEQKRRNVIERCCKEVEARLLQWSREESDTPRVLIDKAERSIYKVFEESEGPLNQIMIKPNSSTAKPIDVAAISQVIKAIEPFKVFRVYFDESDHKAKDGIEKIVEEEVSRCRQ